MVGRMENVYESFGKVTSVPLTEKSDGYGFVELDDGTTAYVPAKIVDRIGLNGEDLGQRVNVRYAKMSDGRFLVLRLYVLRDVDSDQAIADLLISIQFEMDNLTAMMDARGCYVPERVVLSDPEE